MKHSPVWIWGGLAGAMIVFGWLGWPLYGFVSNQFEIARLPVGWVDIPSETPTSMFTPDPELEAVGGKALAILSRHRISIGAPAISAAVAADDRIIWAGAVGWADIERRRPVTIDTPFRIGSTSKAVTATLLARLVDADVLTLDSPVSSNLPPGSNPAWDKLTPRMLASHTAGLVDYPENHDLIGLYQSMALSTHYDDQSSSVKMFDGSQLRFQPGADFHYSGYGMILLAAVMEQATGQTYPEMLRERVLGPLQLTHTSIGLTGGDTAVSYQRKRGRVKPWRNVDLTHKMAAGGLVSTPSDLVRLGMSWMDETFIRPETRETFWTPVKLSSGEINEQDYGLGWRRKSVDVPGVGRVLNLNHGGVSKGAQCWLLVAPEHGLTIAVSINARTPEFLQFADVQAPLLSLFLPLADRVAADRLHDSFVIEGEG